MAERLGSGCDWLLVGVGGNSDWMASSCGPKRCLWCVITTFGLGVMMVGLAVGVEKDSSIGESGSDSWKVSSSKSVTWRVMMMSGGSSSLFKS